MSLWGPKIWISNIITQGAVIYIKLDVNLTRSLELYIYIFFKEQFIQVLIRVAKKMASLF